MPRLCSQSLPTGKTCARMALKGERWCPAHRNPDRRQDADFNRCLVESVPYMDIASIAAVLLDTLTNLRAHRTPPLHAQTLFAAASLRLEKLGDNNGGY